MINAMTGTKRMFPPVKVGVQRVVGTPLLSLQSKKFYLAPNFLQIFTSRKTSAEEKMSAKPVPLRL